MDRTSEISILHIMIRSCHTPFPIGINSSQACALKVVTILENGLLRFHMVNRGKDCNMEVSQIRARSCMSDCSGLDRITRAHNFPC